MKKLLLVLFLSGCVNNKRTIGGSDKFYTIEQINGPELVKGEEGMCQYLFLSKNTIDEDGVSYLMDTCGKHKRGDTVIIQSR